MTKTCPGLRRLRASPAAEAIRHSVLADQRKGRADALAKIEAASASELAVEALSPAPAPHAPGEAARPGSKARKASGKRAEIPASAQAIATRLKAAA